MVEHGTLKPMGAAMEGDGYYNRNSAMQAAGIASLTPYWRDAIDRVPLDEKAVIIADYASSQGRNSLAPMRLAIDELRHRAGPDVPVSVVHTDLPSNDFTALFELLEQDGDSYLRDRDQVFASAIGRSYFHQLFPANSVLLGWNTWSIHWMTGEPINAPDHVLPAHSKDREVLAALRTRQDEDWRAFLRVRGRELKSGGRLLCAFVAQQNGLTGWEYLGSHFWGAICDVRDAGYLSPAECTSLTVSASSRSKDQILEPFAEGTLGGLQIEVLDILTVSDPHWAEYKQSDDAALFGKRHSDGVRAWAGPDLVGRLGKRQDATTVVDSVFARLAERVAADPHPHTPYLAVVVLKKQ